MMLLKKSSLLALMAVSCVAAVNQQLRVNNRDLIKSDCSTEMKNLTCSVRRSHSGSGKAWSFISVATVRSPNALVLDHRSFDPNGCYNIRCQTSDTPHERIVWSGSFDEKDGYKVSSKSPYYLSGRMSGAGCTKLAPTFEALNITIQLIKAPPRGATDLRPYICAEVTIASGCFQCPVGMVPITDCPVSVWDCGCPAQEVLVGGNKCRPCEAGFYYNNGSCIFECPGDLVPFRIGPYGMEDCVCPPDTRAVHSFDKCEPCQYELDGSGDCPCPDNQLLIYKSTCKPCGDEFTLKDGKCCFNCPENMVPLNSCPRSVDSCACSDMGSRRLYKDCEPCSKLDSQGYCKDDWCTTDFQCPANSKRIPGLRCYSGSSFQCECDPGYQQALWWYEWGKCKPCPQGQKLDARGRCVQEWCDNKYFCPQNSETKHVDVDCFDSFDYCECFNGFHKEGGYCIPNEGCTNCQGWPWFYG